MAAENRKPGSPTWRITQAASNHEIEGYASSPSAAPGDTVTLFVNASQAHAATWELYRVGYYGGVGARLVATAPFAATKQAPCPVDTQTGLVECAWKPSVTVPIEGEWFTGQYLFKLVREDGFESYVPLVIREPAPKAPIIFQASVTTWQAYNLWGGSSLYKNLLPASAGYTPDKARRVSFDRPYEYKRPIEAGQPETEFGAGHLFLAEIFMLQWLEMKGYDVAYVTNLDVDQNPEVLANRLLFLSVGHDEYWTEGERDAVDHARDAGVSLGFFSANDAYWRIRLDPSAGGVPNRVVTCYKNPNLDPNKRKTERTVRFRDDDQPEDALIGQMYGLFTSMDAFPLIVGDASHWLYDGTHASEGDTLSHVVGYEWDRVQTPALAPPSLEVISSSPVVDHFGLPDVSDVTAYYPTSSSLVFSAGTISWSWGLGKPGFEDPRIQRMTENVLSRAGLRPFVVTSVPPHQPPQDHVKASEVTLVAGTGKPGYVDGPSIEAQFDSPLGVAVTAGGVIYVTEARNHRIRKIAAIDGRVSTLAGCAPDDQHVGNFADGEGTDACFNLPSGIAVAEGGTIYVSDTNNHRIRAITPTGMVTTIAGNGSTTSSDSENPLYAGIPYPRGFAIGPDGAFYVIADATTVRRIDAAGVTTVATSPSELSGVVVAADGTLYVVATGASTVSILQHGQLVPLVNPLAIFGDRSGPGDTAMLRPAEGLVVDGTSLVVSDSANYKVRRIELSPSHEVTTLVGDGWYGDALGTAARVVNPRGIAVMASCPSAAPGGPSSTCYIVADSGNHRILRVRSH
jgi:DNA-binding beta-propeller fold protein YncE